MTMESDGNTYTFVSIQAFMKEVYRTYWVYTTKNDMLLIRP